jgi:hypothetical protein
MPEVNRMFTFSAVTDAVYFLPAGSPSETVVVSHGHSERSAEHPPSSVFSGLSWGLSKFAPPSTHHPAFCPSLSAFVPRSARTGKTVHLRRFHDLDGLHRGMTCISEEMLPIMGFIASSAR